jgi:hypothetical protein
LVSVVTMRLESIRSVDDIATRRDNPLHIANGLRYRLKCSELHYTKRDKPCFLTSMQTPKRLKASDADI